jgi:AmmeMemoRadiSam system protein B
MQKIRKATHAGSWYTDSSSLLTHELNSYLQPASIHQSSENLKILIGPHAGYSFSGPTAGWAYKSINPNNFSTIFILGPSHHAYFQGCSLPFSTSYSTPLGDLPVDSSIIETLRKSGGFGELSKKVEEKEHSLEMHLPFIRHVFLGKDVKIVPIMVGDVTLDSVTRYGRTLERYLKDNRTLFVVSSDFCHWGENFEYMPYDRSKGKIFQSIESLDREGMRLIEQHDLPGFKRYLEMTENTICGCNPIMIALATIRESSLNLRTEFVRYAQSNQVETSDDFSVSYASSLSYSLIN